MCGIAGRFSPSGGLGPVDVADVVDITQCLHHRGPDAGGLLDRVPHAVLGHRRLSIIDLSGGRQPMASPDGKVWLTFNGEIYNFLRLRKELQRDYAFATQGDSEVILAAYLRWGEACVEKLEGMFAFAIYDSEHKSLLMARDHVGKKPLYYRWRGGVFDFASEVQALRLASDWQGKMDALAWAFYLRLGYIPSPYSVYEDVKKLRPGESLRVDTQGLHPRLFWEGALNGREVERSRDEHLDLLTSQLHESVQDRLVSEVPLGAFLSGGIDSNLVVSEMSSISREPAKTVSIGFEGEPGELEAARLAAAHHGADHQEFVVSPDYGQDLKRIVLQFGEPFADSSALPTWYVSREARRRVTVALSGDGGDEPHGGYDFRYDPHLRDYRLRRLLPGGLRKPLFGTLARMWPKSHALPRYLRLASLMRNLAVEEDEAFFLDLCFTPPWLARKLAPGIADLDGAVEEHVRSLYQAGNDGDPLQAIMRADVRFYMTEDVLVKVDRMSMAHALEVRSPFMDKRLVELAFTIPSQFKVEPGKSKALLRALAQSRIPPEVAKLPKRGFHIPKDRWFRTRWKQAFEEDVLGASTSDLGWLDKAAIGRVFRLHQEGKFEWGYPLWAIWVIKMWLDAQHERPATKPDDLVRVGGGEG